jgi:4'-phosphopantetheinyl transferase
VRFNAPVKVHGDRVTEVIVEARPAPRGDEVRTRLISVRKLRTGRVTRTEHFSATIVFGEDAPPDGLPSAFLPDEPVTAEAIYQRFFHGPRFQVLRDVFGVSQDGLVAEASVDHAGIADGLVTEPLILEAAFQAAGLHRMITAHEMGLPMEIDEVSLMGSASPSEKFSLTVQKIGGAYDIDVDGVGGPLMRVRGFSMIDRGPLDPEKRWPEPEGGRPVCFPEGTASTRGGGRTTAEAHADEALDAWLTAAEQAELRQRGTAKRIRDRLAGRVAAKRALVALTGVDPLAIQVVSASTGEPIARVPGRPGVSVSISHREGRAVAVAVEAGRVGVDLEAVEQRPVHFAQTWFDARERELASDPTAETVIWSAKEAVLKALGTGFALSPNQVRVVAIEGDRIEVSLSGEAARRHVALGGGTLVLRWARFGGEEVLVEARLAA